MILFYFSFTWLQCAKWLNKCQLLPNNLKEKLDNNSLDINEFSNGLRDGLILFSLINFISPGSLDSSEVNWRSKSRITCLTNIRVFLETCKKKLNLNDEDLFQADMLYDLNMERVFSALSKISNLQIAKEKSGTDGFEVNKNEYDLYENIEVLNDTVGNYTPADDIVGEFDYMYDEIMKVDNSGTSLQFPPSLNESRQSGHFSLSNRDRVIKEFFESETKFVNTLQIIISDFVAKLGPILNDVDKNVVFINIETLRDLHMELLKKLREAIEGQEGRARRVCGVYDSYKLRLMKDYVDYFGGMHKAMLKIDSLLSNNKAFKLELEKCRSNSKMGIFQLNDLMRLPYQRVLKYHLLFAQLNKYTEKDHSAKQDIQKTLSNMNDLSAYLNESQRQHEILEQLEILNNKIRDFNFKPTITLKDFGQLIKDDKVQIKEVGEAFAKMRTILLLNQVLFICKCRGDFYYHKHRLLLNEYKVEEDNTYKKRIITSNCINLVSNDRSKVYSFIFKDSKLKEEWKATLVDAIDRLQPTGYNNKNHLFVLFNFKREIVNCSICQALLHGIFYQGYKCMNCNRIAHKACIKKLEASCNETNNSSLKANLSATDTEKRTIKKFEAYKVRALYSYQGRPSPTRKECQILMFNVGDIIIVTDDDDDDFWKGYKIDEKSYEGYFPANSVQEIRVNEYENDQTGILQAKTMKDGKNLTLLESKIWFANCDAKSAKEILNSIENPSQKTIFLVRPSDDGGYSVSIRHNSLINHMRIFRTSLFKFTLDKITEFQSLEDLVNYYVNHSLKDSFPQMNTTLGIPYKNTTALKLTSTEMIENEDWYSGNNREMANKILTNLQLEDNTKAVFLVRPSQNGRYAIAIKFNLKIQNIQILSTLSSAAESEDGPEKFCLHETSLKFSSIRKLMSHYMVNSLAEVFPTLNTPLGIPFRKALPKPIETVTATNDYNPKSDFEIEVVKNQNYSIISKDVEKDMWNIFNSDGLMGFAPKHCFT